MKEVKLNLHNRTIELILPLFFGGLSSLLLCAYLETRNHRPAAAIPARYGEIENNTEIPFFAQTDDETPALEKESFVLAVGKPEKRHDIIQETYRTDDAREWVIDFFGEICGSGELAETILLNADAYDISPALAFALSWEESRFNPRAVSAENKNESVDRGLFQLNSRSFPRLDIQSFFDPKINTKYAMAYLRQCLDIGGSEIAALAMYNAGSGKVSTIGTPRHTLDYINRILENRRKIESQFELLLIQWEAQELAQKEVEDAAITVVKEKPVRPRVWFAPLQMRFEGQSNISGKQ